MRAVTRRAVTLSVVALGALPATQARQDQQLRVPQTFRAGVDLVTVDVSVRDGNGPVAGLGTEDFVVLDNGVPQTVDVVEVSSLPIDVTVLIDTSGSMIGDLDAVVAQVRAATALIDARDQLRVVTFAWDVQAGRFSAAEGAEAIGNLRAFGATALLDGLAIALMRPRVEDRRHLVIAYTDGGANYGALGGDDIMMVSRRTESVLQVILVIVTPGMATVSPTPNEELRLDIRRRWYPPAVFKGYWSLGEVARNTGGDLHVIGARADSTATISEIIGRFRESYVLRYRVTGVPLPGWHDIDVRVPNRGGLSVRARRGYFIDER